MDNTIWLVNSTLFFYPISWQRGFFIIKTVASGKNSVIFGFFFRHNCNKSLWKNIFLVIFHSLTSPLVSAPPQLPLSPSPTTCAVENFQRWIFVKSQSPDKFTGKPKTQVNVYIYIAHHLPIYEVNGTAQYQGHISMKVFDLPPIITQSSPYFYRTRRTTFQKWRSKIIWRRRNIWSWGMARLPLLCNSKRRTNLINRWRKNIGPWHKLRQGRLCSSFGVSFPCTIFFSISYPRTWASPQK